MFPMFDSAARFPAGASVCDRKPTRRNIRRVSLSVRVARSRGWACRHRNAHCAHRAFVVETHPLSSRPGRYVREWRFRSCLLELDSRARLRARDGVGQSMRARERTSPFPFCPESIVEVRARCGRGTRAERVKSAKIRVDAPCRGNSSRALARGGQDAPSSAGTRWVSVRFAPLVPLVRYRKMCDLIGYVFVLYG